ncbi:MAG: c-type cytochrome [Opitutaceae bacterium]|nr:c-type cytochrome [Opitutaceae bacterium]
MDAHWWRARLRAGRGRRGGRPSRKISGLILCGTLGLTLVSTAAEPLLSRVELPAGLDAVVAAAPPLLNYPIMGCLDDRGRLFIGDAAGLNLDKKSIDEQLPNRVIVLEDTNGDGTFDRSNVFADKMTFPSGGVWLDGSLYVASPPGIWKLTDTNGDAVADRRELVVDGFDFHTGNGTHIHGPFLHPNGRLFWCGNQRAKVVQKDGTLVRDGRATGVWSADPDGGNIEWHSLGGMANSVEVDFTPEGEVIGVVNIHYQQPRGDTLIHWLYGGVYERADGGRTRNTTLADLPHTRDHMPPVHNFGHVAVSGFLRYRSGTLNPAWQDNLFVTFFNTQKLVRVALAGAGASYKATEHEFFKLNDPNAHFADVIEDADGSLLVLDTGGWFRRGCPSSLSSKPDLRGAVYRIRRQDHPRVADAYGSKIDWSALPPAELDKLRTDPRWMVREKATRLSTPKGPATITAGDLLDSTRPHGQLRALENIARSRRLGVDHRDALLQLLAAPLDATLEHAAMFAAINTNAFNVETLRAATNRMLARRLIVVLEQTANDPERQDAVLRLAKVHFDSSDAELARTALGVASRHPRAIELCYDDLNSLLTRRQPGARAAGILMEVTVPQLAKPPAQKIVAAMLQHSSLEFQQTAWRIIVRQAGKVSSESWFPPLEKSLQAASAATGGADLQLLLEAIGKLQTKRFDPVLQRIMQDPLRPLPTRLKALAALSRPGEPLKPEAFGWLLEILTTGTSVTARVDAARFLTQARLKKEQLHALAPTLATAGPMELSGLLLAMRKKIDPETGRLWAQRFAQSPVFGSFDESVVRSNFQSLPSEVYEEILGPAVRQAAAANDAKRRKLEALTARAADGRSEEGRKIFAASSCIACHKATDIGRAVGPDLSRIGQIRQPRDLLESILFPNATIAQDYETHLVETADGQSVAGMIKSETADALVLLDLGGQEKSIPSAQILGRHMMSTSLMPAGLEQAFTDQQLLDLVAWLRALK